MPSKEQLLQVYEISKFAKELDDKVQAALMSGNLKTTWFSWRGSELLGAVVGLSLRRDDYLIAYYRDAMSQLAKGFPPTKMFAEALGKVGGSHRGKSGHFHFIDLDSGVVMNSGIVAGQVPIAAGWALSSVLRGDDRVTVCTFGDGAVNEGAFHEAMTLASLWKLPIIYVCFNNLYSEHTAFATTSPTPRVADRAVGYNVPAVTVDGDDVVATWDVMETAIERARSGGGPTLVEAMTYRFRGHNRFDTMAYAPKGEVQARIAADPVVRLREWLIAEGHASESDLANLDKKALDDVEDTWQFGINSPYPDLDILMTDVWAPA